MALKKKLSLKNMKIGTKILIICLILVIVPTSLLGLVAYNSSSAAINNQVDTLLNTKILDVHYMTANTNDLAQESLKGDLQILREVLYTRGTPQVVDGKLVFKGNGGEYVVNDNYEIVDQITKMTGAKATIFQKAGTQAVRVSTNVIGADGLRAVGTTVSQPVYDAVVNQGETYYGTADVVGTPYMTVYEPIRSSNGEIIGILFVGLPEEKLYGALKKEIRSTKLGESGYLYIMDSSGTLIAHPTIEGQNLGTEDFVKQMIANKNNAINEPQKIEYIFNGADAVAYYMYLEPLDWIIASRVNPADFSGPIDDIRNAIVMILLGSIAVGAVISIMFGRSISRRMERLVKLGARVREGDLNGAARTLEEESGTEGGDEIGEVSKAFGGVVSTIGMFKDELGVVNKAAYDGKLDIRGDPVKFTGDYAALITGLNGTLDAVIGPLNMSAEYMDRISKGDIPVKITDDYKGDFNEIKNNLNQCIDAVNLLVRDANMLSAAAVEGKLDTRADMSRHLGDFRKVMQGVNDTLDAVIGPLNMSAEYMDRISKGDVPAKITDQYKGDFNEIKNNLNQCIDAINLLVKDAVMLAKAAEEGKLDIRANTSAHQGDFKKIVEGFNETLDMVIKPVNEAITVCQSYATGDFTVRFDEGLKVSGDFIKFKSALNNLGIQVSDAINVVNGQVENLSSSAEEVNASIEEVSSGAAQIAKNVAVVSGNAESASEGFSQVLKALEDLSTSVQDISLKTEKVSTLAQGANDLSKNGAILAGKAEEGMNGITKNAVNVAALVNDIKDQMDQIGKIVDLITDLANQTNLLALNAAIEAARAGDAGRGFAVVATEVKSLAQESRTSAESIADMIETLQTKSMQAATAMTDAGHIVKEGSGALNETLAAFTSIVDAIDEINRNLMEVAGTTQEQAASVEEITASASEMGNAVDNTSREAQDAAAASEEASAALEQITKVMTDLNSIVNDVSGAMSRFRTT